MTVSINLTKNFKEKENDIFHKDMPLFFDNNLFILIPKINLDKTEENLNTGDLIHHIISSDEKYKKIFDILKKLSGVSISEMFYDLMIQIKINFESYSYEEYFNIEAKLTFPVYYGDEPEEIEDIYETAKGLMENLKEILDEDEFKKEIKKETGKELEINDLVNVFENIIKEIQNFAEKIEKFYEDILNDNYYNNPKYKKENRLIQFLNYLNTDIIKILKLKDNDEFKNFIFKLLDNKYSEFSVFQMSSEVLNNISFTVYFIDKYKELFINIDEKILNLIKEKFFYQGVIFYHLKKYSKGKEENIYELSYFKEDEENLYKPVKEQNKEYEEIFNAFVKSIENEVPKYLIEVLSDKDGNTQKEIIKYINSRLFEEYFNDNEFKTYFDEQLKNKFLYYAYKLAPLFPVEFAVFAISYEGNENIQKYEKKDMLKNYIKKDKEINKKWISIVKEKNMLNKDYISKILIKNITKNQDIVNKKKEKNKIMILILKNGYKKPLSLCHNPLKEKSAILLGILKFSEKNIGKHNLNKENNIIV